ncbi:MAG TPA: TSUP family transporter [Advenella sp.]|nr:TSUP family transporter [Advenella sp.]
MEVELGWNVFLILFFVAMLAGFVDALAGGGGLIVIPVMMLMGFPVLNVLATNKLQGSVGTLASSLTMMRRGVIQFRQLRVPALMSFAGACLGTVLIQMIDPSVLDFLIPLVLLAIGLYFLLTPSAGQTERAARIGSRPFEYGVVPAIGFYDGFFGPGAGSFFSLANITLRGMHIVKASGAARLFNFASNVASVAVFIVGGQVLWLVGAVMICGQIVGSVSGSVVAVNHGARLIRPLIVVVCFAMVIRFLVQRFWS